MGIDLNDRPGGYEPCPGLLQGQEPVCVRFRHRSERSGQDRLRRYNAVVVVER